MKVEIFSRINKIAIVSLSFIVVAILGLCGVFFIMNEASAAVDEWTWESGDKVINQLGVYGTKGVPNPANKPGSRHLSVSWTDSKGDMWLFGGYGFPEGGASGYLNDLWKYDSSIDQWSWEGGDKVRNQLGVYGTKGVPALANKPGARYSSVSWTDSSGNLWLFGGWGYPESGSYGFLNDLWKYDPLVDQWSWEGGEKVRNQNGVSS